MVQCTVSESRMERPGPVSLRGVTGPAGSWLRRYQSARGVAAVAIQVGQGRSDPSLTSDGHFHQTVYIHGLHISTRLLFFVRFG